MAASDAAPDPLSAAASALHDLYLIRDTFFSADPSSKKARLDNGTSRVLAILDNMPPGWSPPSFPHEADRSSHCIPRRCAVGLLFSFFFFFSPFRSFLSTNALWRDAPLLLRRVRTGVCLLQECLCVLYRHM
jgi:hypothetical protein